MVMRPTNQLKRVKDLEPGDRVWFYGFAYEVEDIRNGHRQLINRDERGHIANRTGVPANSRQWVEVIENSKRITND